MMPPPPVAAGGLAPVTEPARAARPYSARHRANVSAAVGAVSRRSNDVSTGSGHRHDSRGCSRRGLHDHPVRGERDWILEQVEQNEAVALVLGTRVARVADRVRVTGGRLIAVRDERAVVARVADAVLVDVAL